MNSKSRIERLEKAFGANKPEPPWVVVVYDNTGEPSEAALEKAKAEYEKEHPDWQKQYLNVICVIDECTNKNVGRVKAREKTR